MTLRTATIGVVLLSVGLCGCDGGKSDADEKLIESPTGLKYVDLQIGTGDAVATKGKTVSVHCLGTLKNGNKFYSSHDDGQPIEFEIGTTGIIQGWNEGVTGMKVGGKRKLIIPPNLAYGEKVKRNESGRIIIPANSELTFEVELVKMK